MKRWPFSTRGARIETAETLPLIDLATLNFSVFQVNDACIKLWLPERLTAALDRLSVKHDTSRPDVLRRLLFEHVFGMEAFIELTAWKKRQEALRAEQAEQPMVLRSKRNLNIEMFGKASEDFKLWLPARLKAEIETLAKFERMGVSDYLRKTLVRLLLGEREHMNWQAAIGPVPKEEIELEG